MMPQGNQEPYQRRRLSGNAEGGGGRCVARFEYPCEACQRSAGELPQLADGAFSSVLEEEWPSWRRRTLRVSSVDRSSQLSFRLLTDALSRTWHHLRRGPSRVDSFGSFLITLNRLERP